MPAYAKKIGDIYRPSPFFIIYLNEFYYFHQKRKYHGDFMDASSQCQ